MENNASFQYLLYSVSAVKILADLHKHFSRILSLGVLLVKLYHVISVPTATQDIDVIKKLTRWLYFT